MKIAILVSGVPGSGKTTLARELLKEFQDDGFFKEDLVIGHKTKKGIIIFGDYQSNDVFSGLDKASMAISPIFQEYIKKNNPEKIFLEGDRLVGGKTIDFLEQEGYHVFLYILVSSNLDQRYRERGSDQSEQFLKSKKTKVDRLSSRMDMMMEDRLFVFENETIDDLNRISRNIQEKFGV